jgi:hypothetical protein
MQDRSTAMNLPAKAEQKTSLKRCAQPSSSGTFARMTTATGATVVRLVWLGILQVTESTHSNHCKQDYNSKAGNHGFLPQFRVKC